MSDWCTNRSADPSSGAMNPNPLVALNHFTVPTVTSIFSYETNTSIGEVTHAGRHAAATRPSGKPYRSASASRTPCCGRTAILSSNDWLGSAHGAPRGHPSRQRCVLRHRRSVRPDQAGPELSGLDDRGSRLAPCGGPLVLGVG